MNPRIAYPFLVLSEEAVAADSWMIGTPEEPLQPVQDVLEHWDYARDLEVAVSVDIDWDKASQALQLPPDQLRMKVSLLAGTGAGTLPRRLERLQVTDLDASTTHTDLSGVLSGHSLSGRLRVSVVITLDAPTDAGSTLSPNVQGARLWQSTKDILIEDGGDSRFPIETASFSRIFRSRPHEHAPWYLHWRPGALQGDFSAGVRLYVNSDHPDWLGRIVGGDGPTLQAMMGDVMSQMVEATLREELDYDELVNCDEGSTGRQILKWLEAAFPAQELASVRALLEHDPGAVRAALVSAADVGGAEQ